MALRLKRRLVNPGKGRAGKGKMARATKRRRRNGPKKMSALQIKFFGTAAQKAALKASRKRKRKNSSAKRRHVKRRRRVNSGTRRVMRKRVHRRRKSKRKNPSMIASLGLAGLNPGQKKRRKNSSAKRKKTRRVARKRVARRKNSGRSKKVARRRSKARRNYHRRRKHSNPGGYRRRRRISGHRRRRNPSIGGTVGIFKSALGVIGGAIAARALTQAVLQGKNTGPMGYVGNAVAALAVGWGVGKFMKNAKLGQMVTIGGFTGLALRLLQDYTPLGQYVNLSLSGVGKAGDHGIGLITDTTFYVPTVFKPGSMTDARVPAQLQTMIAAAGAPKAAGMGSYRRARMAA